MISEGKEIYVLFLSSLVKNRDKQKTTRFNCSEKNWNRPPNFLLFPKNYLSNWNHLPFMEVWVTFAWILKNSLLYLVTGLHLKTYVFEGKLGDTATESWKQKQKSLSYCMSKNSLLTFSPTTLNYSLVLSCLLYETKPLKKKVLGIMIKL